jgi:hypothetical protein
MGQMSIPPEIASAMWDGKILEIAVQPMTVNATTKPVTI